MPKPPSVAEHKPTEVRPISNEEDVKMTVTPYRKSSATPIQQSQEEPVHIPDNEEESYVEIVPDSNEEEEVN